MSDYRKATGTSTSTRPGEVHKAYQAGYREGRDGVIWLIVWVIIWVGVGLGAYLSGVTQ